MEKPGATPFTRRPRAMIRRSFAPEDRFEIRVLVDVAKTELLASVFWSAVMEAGFVLIGDWAKGVEHGVMSQKQIGNERPFAGTPQGFLGTALHPFNPRWH